MLFIPQTKLFYINYIMLLSTEKLWRKDCVCSSKGRYVNNFNKKEQLSRGKYMSSIIRGLQ